MPYLMPANDTKHNNPTEGAMKPRIAQFFLTLRTIAAIMAGHFLVMGGDDLCAAGKSTWVTGTELQQRLGQSVDILWSSTPLRDAVASLSRAQQVAILIDRRIDPGQKLDLTVRNVPMKQALQMIADRCSLGIARLGTVVYLGPPSAAQRLRPLSQAFQQASRRLSPSIQQKLLLRKAMVWEDLATPRELISQLGEKNGVEITGLDQIPHDLWAAADLPSLSLADRLTLIAIQFDLTFKASADGRQLELTPIPDDLRPSAADKDGFGPLRPATPTPRTKAGANLDRTRIQRMAVQSEPLGPVLRQLADRLGLELRINEEAIAKAGISLDQRVSVKVENATVDELFHELLKSTGLTFQRRQRIVEIAPAK